MFSKKRKQQELATQKGLGISVQQQLDEQARTVQAAQEKLRSWKTPPAAPHQRTTSASTTASNAQPLVSPLQMTFDFEIPPAQHAPSPLRETRPQTSDGVLSGGNMSSRAMVGGAPMLPKIPRVASNNDMRSESEADSLRSTPSQSSTRSRLQKKKSNSKLSAMPPPEPPPPTRFDSDNASMSSTKSRRKSRIKSFFGLDAPPDLASLPRSSSTTSIPQMPPPPVVPPMPRDSPSRPTTSAASPITMEPSLFPTRGSSSPAPPQSDANLPAMTRAWVDARDRGYGPPAAAPKRPAPPQPTQSSPDLGWRAQSPSANFSKRSPLSGSDSPTTFTRPSPSSFASSPLLQRPPSNAPTNYSGSTARSIASSRSTAATDSAPTITVGTPYQETSPSFPLPQHVATRPKTAGTATSTIAGVNVPTHHTSQTPDSGNAKPTDKSERRKTRLLNPLALLSRRRSAQEEEALSAERQAQAAALQQQRNVAATGFVKKLPNNFDPSIRGSGVHDFSAPRFPKRGMSYSSDADTDSLRDNPRGLIPTPLIQAPDSTEQGGSNAERGPKLTFVRQSFHSNKFSTSTNDSSSTGRRTTGFQEHLGDDSPAGRVHAERLENKDFLQRASYLSQQSSIVSADSVALPPFARRSQVWDSLNQNGGQNEDGSRPGSGQSRSTNVNGPQGQRDSGVSSVSGISPVTAGSGAMGGAYDNHTNLSPVSPSSDRRESKGSSGTRPISAVSAGSKRSQVKSSNASSSSNSDIPPAPSPLPGLAEARAAHDPQAPRTSPRPPISITIPVPQAPARTPPQIPPRNASHTYPATSPLSTINSPSLDIHSDAPTPEPQVANSVRYSQLPSKTPAKPKLVEKRPSAPGHSSNKRTPSNGMPTHHASNASRFSFQLGGSAAEELALEDKARKLRQNGEGVSNTLGDEDDEDFFDEDAMDDMDEMEMEGQDDQPSGLHVQHLPPAIDTAHRPVNAADPASAAQFMYRPAATITDKRASRKPRMSALDLQIDPYDSGESEDEEEPYWMHEDFLGYEDGEQSRRASETENPDATTSTSRRESNNVTRQRGASASSGLAINTSLANGVNSKNGFYMQPHANVGYPTPPTASSGTAPRALRNSSGSDERQRSLAGFNFATATVNGGQMVHQTQHTPAMSSSTVGGTSSSSETRTLSTGLGLSGFSDFKFIDSAPNSRPTSFQKDGKEHRRTKDSDTVPDGINWTADSAKPSPALRRDGRGSGGFDSPFGRAMGSRRPSSPLVIVSTQPNLDPQGPADDDMYFDDGNFDQDINAAPPPTHNPEGGTSVVDESAFDDPNFLARNSGAAPQPIQLAPRQQHHRDNSALTATSLASSGDGPYPSFAIPNAPAARARDSRLLLEDLPLHEPQFPVDPKLIPRRNPSEDAKRLGLSSKAPPLPPQPGSAEAAQRVQANLVAYHAALAEAATRAAAEGRFLRAPSQRTETTNGEDGGISREVSVSSQYSRGMEGEDTDEVDVDSAQAAAAGPDPPPPKLSFDFGFDNSFVHDFGNPTLPPTSTLPSAPAHLLPDHSTASPLYPTDDALSDADDIFSDYDAYITAANAEALANDDEGFYGSEFGFYAKARPNSNGELDPVHGGYFGLDGDDGLTRNKSLKEPNLTPITERSEFSTRNSFVGGPGSAGAWGGPGGGMLARLPISPLGEGEITSFDQLRRLRAQAFGGSQASSVSLSEGRGSQGSLHQLQIAAAGNGNAESPTLSARSSGAAPGYFGGGALGGAPMAYGYSNESNGSNGAYPPPQFATSAGGYHSSPQSATSSSSHHALPFSTSASGIDTDVTPRKAPVHQSPSEASPPTARKAVAGRTTHAHSAMHGHGHSRNSSGADSVTYVKEMDPEGGGAPRWVLERRRTSEAGEVEVVGREVVQGGWI